MSTKSYVLITGLPPTFKGNGFFYKMLKKQVSSGLLGAVLEDESGKGLAIFDTPSNALAACKEHISFQGKKDDNGSAQVYDAKLRIVETENQVRVVEDVYQDSIEVEGESVKKDDIDFTYGYQLVLRGTQGAKWCDHTMNKEPCPLSVKCKYIHLKAFQQGKKRLRATTDDSSCLGGAVTSGTWSDDINIVPSTLSNLPYAPKRLASTAVIAPKTAEELLAGDNAAIQSVADALFGAAPTKSLLSAFMRVESELGGTTDCDWFTETPEGIAFLKSAAKCLLPPNGCPTPPEKDAFIREMVKRRNIASALHASQPNMTAVQRVKHFLQSPNIRRQLANASSVSVRIILTPRYEISSILQELTFYMRHGQIVGVTQHYDDVLAPASMFDDSGAVKEELGFILERVREVRGQLEKWAASQSAGPSAQSAAFHVAFPSKTMESDKDYPTSATVADPPASMLRLQETITSADLGEPVIVGVKTFESAASRSSVFSATASHDTRNTRPLWRRLKTSPTPMFSRSVIDKFHRDD